VAGTVDHVTGTRDRRALRGLRRAMPLTATAALIAAISMAGLPPAVGFLAKELLFEVTTHSSLALILSAVAAAVGALTLVAAGLVALRPFFGPLAETRRRPREGSFGLWAPPLLLAVLGILGGLLTP